VIYLLAGVNGAGKSSIGGSSLRAAGWSWYNPDEVAHSLHAHHPDRPLHEINSQVWHEGKRRLESAIRDNTNFAFETMLGGSTITNTLHDAIAVGVAVSVWYCGLTSPELHIERVAASVARGGHDIPEELIRSRYRSSMRNLCRLAPGLHRLSVYDNSLPLDERQRPRIRCLIERVENEIRMLDRSMPDWAKPVAAVCLNLMKQ
jgi:predicted ABC-type ATPase